MSTTPLKITIKIDERNDKPYVEASIGFDNSINVNPRNTIKEVYDVVMSYTNEINKVQFKIFQVNYRGQPLQSSSKLVESMFKDGDTLNCVARISAKTGCTILWF